MKINQKRKRHLMSSYPNPKLEKYLKKNWIFSLEIWDINYKLKFFGFCSAQSQFPSSIPIRYRFNILYDVLAKVIYTLPHKY